MTPANGEVNLTRTVDAPANAVFRMWIDSQELRKWWGPHDYTVPYCELHVRAGGAIQITMRGPDGKLYPGGGYYQEVLEPTKLIFNTTLKNDMGVAILENTNAVTFDEQDGKTTLTLRVRNIKVTPEAKRSLEGMADGWEQSLQRLVDHIAATASPDTELAAGAPAN